jgi:hypothetical protein
MNDSNHEDIVSTCSGIILIALMIFLFLSR